MPTSLLLRLLSQSDKEVVIVGTARLLAHMGVDAAIPLPYKVSTVTCATLRERHTYTHTHIYTHTLPVKSLDTHF